MAVIDATDVKAAWLDAYRKGQGMEEFAPDLPDSTQIQQMLQAIEDFWQAGKTQLFADMKTASGFTTLTPAQAKVLGRTWLKRHAEGGNQ